MTAKISCRRLPDAAPSHRAGAPRRVRLGFTLLEVVLALALSTLVISAIAAAIRLHLLMLDRQQADIERSQVARAVLHMIANDLRSAIQYKPADVSALEELAASQAAMLSALGGSPAPSSESTGEAGDESSTDTGGDPTESGNTSSQGADSSASTPSYTAPAAEDTAAARPGLFGDSSQVVVDISRLPRIDEYVSSAFDEIDSAGLPTDIKRVSYYVVSSQGMRIDASPAAGGLGDGENGLVRRQIDRAVAAMASDLDAYGTADLIAREVVQVQFRYFDGTDWRDAWDSVTENGFPSAVEVTVWVDARRPSDEPSRFDTMDPNSLVRYRTVVYLPVAEILPPEEETPAASDPAPATSAPNTSAPSETEDR